MKRLRPNDELTGILWSKVKCFGSNTAHSIIDNLAMTFIPVLIKPPRLSDMIYWLSSQFLYSTIQKGIQYSWNILQGFSFLRTIVFYYPTFRAKYVSISLIREEINFTFVIYPNRYSKDKYCDSRPQILHSHIK